MSHGWSFSSRRLSGPSLAEVSNLMRRSARIDFGEFQCLLDCMVSIMRSDWANLARKTSKKKSARDKWGKRRFRETLHDELEWKLR